MMTVRKGATSSRNLNLTPAKKLIADADAELVHVIDGERAGLRAEPVRHAEAAKILIKVLDPRQPVGLIHILGADTDGRPYLGRLLARGRGDCRKIGRHNAV